MSDYIINRVPVSAFGLLIYLSAAILSVTCQSAHAQANADHAAKLAREHAFNKEANKSHLIVPVSARYDITLLSGRSKSQAVPTGINDKGVIVGFIFDGLHELGVRYRSRTCAAVGNQITNDTDASGGYQINGINNAGVMVGTSFGRGGVYGGFKLQGGSFRPITRPSGAVAGEFWQAKGINDKGQIVGIYADRNNVYLGFIRTAGDDTVVEPPTGVGAGMSRGIHSIALNNEGSVAGTFLDASGDSHGFIFRSGNLIVVDRPGFRSTSFTGVNDHGVIVGSSRHNSGSQDTNYPFLWKNGKFYPVETSTIGQSIALTGLNNKGQVIGILWQQAKAGVPILLRARRSGKLGRPAVKRAKP